jgi:hypothetical protein
MPSCLSLSRSELPNEGVSRKSQQSDRSVLSINNVAFVAIKMGRRQGGRQARAGPGAGRDRVPVRQLPDRS